MRRREFIAVVGCAAVANLLPAHAQQAERVYRVGWVASTSPVTELIGPNPTHPYAKAFLQAMRELGYVDGKNLVIEWRSAEGKFERLPQIVGELVALKVDVIVSPADVVIEKAKPVTSTIPIVMAGVVIPVERGFVQSLSRPGGNITGLSSEAGIDVVAKRVELIKELVPSVRRLVSLQSAENPPEVLRSVEEASRRLGLSFLLAEHSKTDFANAFELIRRERPDAMHVALNPGTFVKRHFIIEFAAENHIPTVYPGRYFIEAGGLICYAANSDDLNRRAAGHVDRILKGASPADLPVEQPTKFDLAINLRTAKELGLSIPACLLVQASEVLE
jgi:putative tryptophan/tyrosine transport system substrate-binding protein